MKHMIRQIFTFSALTLAVSAANAAAFQLQEVTTSGLGRAYAGEAAIADNAGIIATNPALMTQFKRPEVSFGGVWINPGVDIEGTFSVQTPNGTLSSNAGYHDAITSKLIPNGYFVLPLNEQFAIGGGANVNYGLATDYDANYAAGPMGGTTDLTTINLNLSGAYRLNQHWSFGLGVNAVYAKAELARRAGATAPILNQRINAAAPNQGNLNSANYLTYLEGKDWGYGWNAGLTYEINPNHRFGVAFHSKVKIKFDGEVSNDLPGGLNHVPGGVELNLPDYWEFSGYHQLTSAWAVHYSYKYTKWSRLQHLQAYTNSGAQVFSKTEHFQDTSRVALGTSYDLNDKLTLRAGIAYDQGAADTKPSISIPDTDRMWYSLGATYKFTPDLSVDFAYAYISGKTRHFVEKEGNTVGNFTSRAQVNLYGLNVNYRF